MKYLSPDVEVMQLYSEGVLCGSYDLNMDPEDGNM